ncbi:SA1320 family protein [Alkalihalobacillus trypoxylicola]|uniref:Uncharacterized protein n=1 Tax=Alkalihalobacillus trypoxylicola TaxID=519424 RepID=A0A162D0U0_9BACI|nr:hypothetical protein [Alkalihalobacillus trypoxylicola]KYG27635.1 hypothetical protein AZF04_10610 [Alkalihalobacillus trypoxylicola]
MKMSYDITPKQNIDKELIRLAGYHAYENIRLDSEIKINNSIYRTVDTSYFIDTLNPTGLDALTVQNLDTGEYIVVYQGSSQIKEDWLETNTKLLSNLEPAQFVAAQDYFDSIEETFGEVSYVTGNSLAGALANSVAVRNPHVKSVTINPAMLPGGIIDPDKDYPNIVNYYSSYDFLTITQQVIGKDDRIPGKKHLIYNGVPVMDMIGSNHKGYKVNDKGEFVYEIGVEGKPGHGQIHIGADDHILSSFFTGETLTSLSGPSEPVNISTEHLKMLADGIKNQVESRLNHSHEYLINAKEIVQHEHEELDYRIRNLQGNFLSMIDDLSGEPFLKGVSNKTQCNRTINLVEDKLLAAENKCSRLNSVIDFTPLSRLKDLFFDFEDNFNQFSNGIQEINTVIIPDIFTDRGNQFMDAIVEELNAHLEIVVDNKEKVLDQAGHYRAQVQEMANAFEKKDEELSEQIAMKTSIDTSAHSGYQARKFKMNESPYVEITIIKLKQELVDNVYQNLKSIATTFLVPLLVAIEGILISMSLIIKGLISLAEPGKFVLGVSLHFSDIDKDGVKLAVDLAVLKLEELLEVINGLRDGVGSLIFRLPTMIDQFKPYIDSAIFSISRFSDVRLYHLAAYTVVYEMQILFDDIINQLSHNQGKSIKGALETSKSLQINFKKLENQIERAVF